MSDLKHRNVLTLAGLLVLLLAGLLLFDALTSEQILASRQDFDRQALATFFTEPGYDNDVVRDTYLIPASGEHEQLVNIGLLGLQRDRFAYLARRQGEVVAVAVPATADDGFNGTIDLLIAIDMFGRIQAARVLADIDSPALYGIVDVIDSNWMQGFTGNAMRDIKRLSWQTISAENEYDQFVGASITPKAVAERIYNAMVFFQSNRIALMAGER